MVMIEDCGPNLSLKEMVMVMTDDDKIKQNRLALLIRARDEDIFNGIARAKSTLRSTFRKLTGDPLCHIDLEKRLLDAGFTFNDKNFLDAVHFTPQGHLSVAIALDSALREINFCQSARPKPKIQPQPMYMP